MLLKTFFVPCLHKHLVPRFVYAFAARVHALIEPVVVLHSKRKHGRSYSFVLEAFNTYAVLHWNKHYVYCNSVKSL